MEIGKFFHSNYVMGTENMEILKVVIADDEVRICQLIQALIDWDSLGMKVVGIAHNGEDACEMVQQTQPDILITDIRMPGCSGLELVKRVKELDSALEVIIISGYAHFEYAQQAISYGVGHYLLKPVNKGELTATLQKLQKKIGERKESELNHQELVNKAKRDDDHLRANLIDRFFPFSALYNDNRFFLSEKSIRKMVSLYFLFAAGRMLCSSCTPLPACSSIIIGTPFPGDLNTLIPKSPALKCF